MPPRKKDAVESGRFYELRDQVSGSRRGPYKLTEDIVFPEMTRGLMRRYFDAEAPDDKFRILFGDHEAAIEELYKDRPIEEWVAFTQDVRAHYFGQGAEQLPGGSNGS